MNPFISLGYDQTVAGDWTVTLTVSGLPTERQAQIAVEYLRERCCGEQIQPNDGGGMTTQTKAADPVLPPPSHRHPMSGEPICLVAYSVANVAALERSKLGFVAPILRRAA